MHSIKCCMVNCVRLLSCVQAGKLWEDADFDCMKMDAYCKDLQEEAANTNLQNELIQCERNVVGMFDCWLQGIQPCE